MQDGMTLGPFGVPATTPEQIDSVVRDFANELVPGAEPRVVPVILAADAVRLDCFDNVEHKIQRDGGRKLCGWTVWQHEDYMIEGEFHTVWVSPEREWVDVTPHDGENAIIFVPDVSARPPTGNDLAPPNRLKALRDDEQTKATVEMARQGSAFMRAIGVYKGTPFKAKIRPGDPCPCKSGLKFKNCCSPGNHARDSSFGI